MQEERGVRRPLWSETVRGPSTFNDEPDELPPDRVSIEPPVEPLSRQWREDVARYLRRRYSLKQSLVELMLGLDLAIAAADHQAPPDPPELLRVCRKCGSYSADTDYLCKRCAGGTLHERP